MLEQKFKLKISLNTVVKEDTNYLLIFNLKEFLAFVDNLFYSYRSYYKLQSFTNIVSTSEIYHYFLIYI